MPDLATAIAENDASLSELRALVGRLSEVDLAHPLGGGWTIATALGHVAFWDMRAAVMADRWKLAGVPSGLNIDDEGVNEALDPLLLTASGRGLATMALAAALAANTAIVRLQPELAALGFSEDSVFKAGRYAHRREHIEQIEQALRG